MDLRHYKNIRGGVRIKHYYKDIKKNQSKIIDGECDTNEEKWKLITEIDNLYAISSLGRIMSMRDSRIMKTCVRSGYENAILSNIDGKQVGFLVHRLVATAFIPNPNCYPIINHKDINTLNNNIDNLEWCSYKYNCIYNDANKKRGAKMRGRQAHNKYKSASINKGKILHMYNTLDELQGDYGSIGECAKYLSDILGKKYETVYEGIFRAVKKTRKTYLGYKFIYE